MGLRTEVEARGAMPAEQSLWGAVLLQAIKDSAYRGAIAGEMLAKRRARHWAATMQEDFRVVCEMAGVEPARTSEAILFRAPEIVKRVYGSNESQLEYERRRRRLKRGE